MIHLTNVAVMIHKQQTNRVDSFLLTNSIPKNDTINNFMFSAQATNSTGINVMFASSAERCRSESDTCWTSPKSKASQRHDITLSLLSKTLLQPWMYCSL